MTRHKNQPHRNLLRTGLPALYLFFLFLGFSTSAQAYITCNPATMRQAFEGSEAVFMGRLVKITGFDKKQILGKEVLVPGDFFSQEHHFKFKVEKVWKGKVANPATFMTSGPPVLPGSFHWRVQNQYVILVNKNEFNKDQFKMMTAGSDCRAYQQMAWHRKWDMIFLDFLTNKIGVEGVLREARKLTVQAWENLERISSTPSETFFQPKELKSFLHILFEGLKEWNWDDEYGRLAEVLGLAVQRNEKVASGLYEIFQEDSLAWKPGNKRKFGHRERSVFVMALALMESGDQHIQKQAATFLSQPIPWDDYWARWRAEYFLKKVGKWN